MLRNKKHKIKITAELLMNGGSVVTIKITNNAVNVEECEKFINELKTRLDDTLEGWKKHLY